MRFSLLTSCIFLILGCSSAYRHLQPATGDVESLKKFKPAFTVALYNTRVDVIGNHLSGLLLIKKMPDSSTRMVFSNEIGFKFFDFEFLPNGDFKVHSITDKMNKKAVIKTLRKDFELILMERLNPSQAIIRSGNGHIYYSFKQSSGYNHYITNTSGDSLVRLERASARKPVVEAIMTNYAQGIPDSIGFTHTKFDFTIGLKRIQQ